MKTIVLNCFLPMFTSHFFQCYIFFRSLFFNTIKKYLPTTTIHILLLSLLLTIYCYYFFLLLSIILTQTIVRGNQTQVI